jgi:hypothetical protein
MNDMRYAGPAMLASPIGWRDKRGWGLLIRRTTEAQPGLSELVGLG